MKTSSMVKSIYKKVYIISLVLILLFLIFIGCDDVSNTDDELLKIVSINESISSNSILTEIGRIVQDGKLLLCVLETRENLEEYYYAVEFEKKGCSYRFSHTYKLIERGTNIYTLGWLNGYIFICNNPAVKKIQLNFDNKESQEISVNDVPFVYYHSYGLEERYKSLKYLFLDNNNNIIL